MSPQPDRLAHTPSASKSESKALKPSHHREASQKVVYDRIGHPAVQDVLAGRRLITVLFGNDSKEVVHEPL